MAAFARGLFFIVLCAATLTTWIEGAWTTVGLLAAVVVSTGLSMVARERFLAPPWPVAVVQWILIGAMSWGFVQVFARITVYDYPTLTAATQWCVFAGVFFAGSRLFFSRSGQQPALDAFIVFSAAIALLSLVQRYTSNGRFLWFFETGYPEIYGPFPSYKDLAVLMELALPAALWKALRAGERRWLFSVAAAVMAASVVMSGSRAGSALVFAETAAVVILCRGISGRKLATLAAVGLMCAAAGSGLLLSRLRTADSFQFRSRVLLSAFEMARERPLAGFGLGNFATAYPAYARFDDGTRVNYAHSDWAEWMVEGGVPLAAALSVVAALSVPSALRSVWGLGVPAVLIHACVDFPLRRSGVAVWFFFMLAGVLAPHFRPQRCEVSA